MTDYNYIYDSDISHSPSPQPTIDLSWTDSDSDSLFCVSSVNSTSSAFFYLSPSPCEQESCFFPEYGQPRAIVRVEVQRVQEQNKNRFRRFISGIVSGINFDKCFKRYN